MTEIRYIQYGCDAEKESSQFLDAGPAAQVSPAYPGSVATRNEVDGEESVVPVRFS
jgi:hypothetical protein